MGWRKDEFLTPDVVSFKLCLDTRYLGVLALTVAVVEATSSVVIRESMMDKNINARSQDLSIMEKFPNTR